jgi:molybdopterin molybdotransferase
VREPLPIREALALVLARAVPLAPEETPVAAAGGRVLAAPAKAMVDLPPFASSAMDGFAVRANDTPGELAVTARIAAGSPADSSLGPGEAMAISTGAELPAGADAVVQIERVDDRGATVIVDHPVVRHDNVRPRGSDVPCGTDILTAGVILGPAQLGAAAAAGLSVLSCALRPRLAVLATGSELREAGEVLGPGEIYDASGTMIEAQVRSAGAEVERLPRVRDDEGELRAALGRALEAADVVVTTGGASVGEHDFVRRVSSELGVEEVFWGVAVRPGKPLAFGVRGRTLVFGLPGNPVSSLVGVELFVRPALLALQGAATPGPPFRPGRLAVSARRDDARDVLLWSRVSAEGDEVVLEPLGGQESHMIARAASAQALVLVPRGDGDLAAGAAVRYLAL